MGLVCKEMLLLEEEEEEEAQKIVLLGDTFIMEL